MQELTLEQDLLRHAKTFIKQGLASNFDGTINSLMPSIIEYGSDNQVVSIMVGNLAMVRFADLVVKELDPIYKICHTYDIGNHAVYCRYTNLELWAIDLAIYLHFKAESIIDEAVIVDHKTTMKYLELFGAVQVACPQTESSNEKIIKIDMYIERELRCGEWYTTRFVELQQYSEMTEVFINEQSKIDPEAFVV